MVIEGVDYAWARPSPTGLAAAGKEFAVRYGGPGSDGKQLDATELRALRSAGLDVVANAEGSAGGYRGRDAGRAWAQSAEAHFRALGMPADRPIYFSVDRDSTSADWPAIDAALRGSAEIIGAARVGVYAEYDVIAHCVSAGTARWFWQTYAWSGGRWHPRSHLQQYRNGVILAGGTVDLTRATTADYGQWGYSEGDDMDLTPQNLQDIRIACSLGIYDAAWSAANGVDVKTGDGDILISAKTGRAIKNNLQALLLNPMLAEIQEIATQIAQSTGAFTDAQLAALQATLQQAAAEAGQTATQRLEESIESLREHLGDLPAAG